jgi:Flp pilus assembly protein TadG
MWNDIKSSARQNIQQFLRTTRGAAAVEFAMLVPVISALFIGVANFGLAVNEKMELSSAARAGAQMALISTADLSVIRQVVVDSTNLSITTADVTVTQACNCYDGTSISCGATCGDGSDNEYYYTISVTENHTLLLIPTTISLTGTATVRTQ